MFYESYEKAWTNNSIRHIATPSSRARNTYYYIQETGYFKTLSHYYTKRSGLNSYLLVYTLSGIGHLTYDGKNYELGTGDLMFIDCNKEHYYKTDENSLWEIQWVHFNGSNTKGYYDLFIEQHNPIVRNTQPDTIRSIQSYIDHHYNEPITLTLLSELFGMSKYHLARSFKKCTGFSPD